MNRAFNSGINTSPCEALYGKSASVGLATTSLHPSCYEGRGPVTEDDFEAMIAGNFHEPSIANEQHVPESAQGSTCDLDLQEEEEVQLPADETHESVLVLQEEEEVHITVEASALVELSVCGECSNPLTESEFESISCKSCNLLIHSECSLSGICIRCKAAEGRIKKRKIAQEGQEKQAARMLKRTKANLPQLQVGDNVRVGVPKIDRAGLDSPNIIGVVTE